MADVGGRAPASPGSGRASCSAAAVSLAALVVLAIPGDLYLVLPAVMIRSL
jgi:hypothetical protein